MPIYSGLRTQALHRLPHTSWSPEFGARLEVLEPSPRPRGRAVQPLPPQPSVPRGSSGPCGVGSRYCHRLLRHWGRASHRRILGVQFPGEDATSAGCRITPWAGDGEQQSVAARARLRVVLWHGARCTGNEIDVDGRRSRWRAEARIRGVREASRRGGRHENATLYTGPAVRASSGSTY